MLQQFSLPRRSRDQAAGGTLGMRTEARNQVIKLSNPMRRAWKSLVVAACFFSSLLALGLAGRPAAAAEAAQVRIGIARTMSDVGYYVADAMGYFRDEGIEVTMTPFNS